MRTLMTPTLMTAAMIGKPIQLSDLGAMQLLNRDVTVMMTLSPEGKPYPDETVRGLVDAAVAHWADHGFGIWMFCHNTNGNFLGYAGLRKTHVEGGDETELFYALRSPYWGAGLAAQMVKAVMDAAFDQIELDSVVARTQTGNQRSVRVLERAGFRHEKDIEHAGLPHMLYRRTA